MIFTHILRTTSKKSLTVSLKFGKQLSEDGFWCKMNNLF